jgi:rhodanese-related sulfurtransferase
MPQPCTARTLTWAAAAALVLAGCAEQRTPSAARRTGPSLEAAEASRSAPAASAPEAPPAPRYLSVKDAAREIRENPDLFLLCVATEEEYADGHIAGSVLIPVMGLDIGIERNDWFPGINRGRVPRKDQPILCYGWWKTCVCPSIPTYSQVAAGILIRKGYTNVAIIAGGMRDWKKAGLPVETGMPGNEPPE